MPRIYRADLVRPLLWLLVGGLFVASSVTNIVAGGGSPGLALIGLFGGIFVGAGVCILRTRVAVDGSGLAKRAPFAGSFRASWDEIEAWWVHRQRVDPEMLPQACFRLRGRRRIGVVYAADTWRPNFDAFLEDVRARVADRETAEPGAPA
jgi:hypothetical protein